MINTAKWLKNNPSVPFNYFSEDFTNKIKQSIPGEALVFGNCVSMPLHLKIHKSRPSPNSENCNIPNEWFKSPVTFI